MVKQIPLLVDAEAAAAMLGIAVVTVRRMLRRGDLPTVRIGRAVRIPLCAVIALAKAPPPPEINGECEEVPIE